MKWFCECESFDCQEKIEMSLADYEKHTGDGRIVIAANCPCSPEPTDKLVSEHPGFRVYEGEKTE